MNARPAASAPDDMGEAAFDPLGMSAAGGASVRAALSASNGLILIAGPPGSGRAETCRFMLDLRRDAVVGGEIRDAGSAGSAVSAAQAGHLALAMMEAATAAAAIVRLRQLRVEPFLIASTLRAALAQRLVPRLCPRCRIPVQATKHQTAKLGFDPGLVIYEAAGCDACGGTGRSGRIGLFEAIPIDTGLARLIGGGADEAIIASHAWRERPNLASAARRMAREGLISIEDALKVSGGRA